MQPTLKTERPRTRRIRDGVAQASGLQMPAIGMEAEFNVVLDGVEIDPRAFWGDPTAFIDAPLLRRTRSSLQLPTGGAVYFDRGVIEVVTPVIELAEGCTARVVRNLWEQMEFVRAQLTLWEKKAGRHIRLKAYSTHYNVSFDIPESEQRPDRDIQSLALLLAYLLPVPVAVLGTNRRSTGVGVRPRGERIEITSDFTPDPGLNIATATLILGIVREVMSWPSYSLSLLDELPIPTVDGVVPGKHTTRKGWLTKDIHFPQSPFTCDIDQRIWRARDGSRMSLRGMARKEAWFFRRSIRRYADPFSVRLLFAVLGGRAPSLLDLADRPGAYEDVGRLCRWGMVLPSLKRLARGRASASEGLWNTTTYTEYLQSRERERAAQPARDSAPPLPAVFPKPKPDEPAAAAGGNGHGPVHFRQAGLPNANWPGSRLATGVRRRSSDALRRRRHADFVPTSPTIVTQRVRRVALERRRRERRAMEMPTPFPDRRLTRSAYEQVFLKLVSGGRLRIGTETYRPVGMKGWDVAVFRREADGRQRTLSIDQLLGRIKDWQE
jgi:hypothetical protein